MSDPAGQTTVITVTPPGGTEPVDVEVNVFGFTLAERNLAKKAVLALAEPDILEIMAVNAWVVWRRDHPDTKLDDWFNGITFGDMLNNPLGSVTDQPIVTPDGYDPEA